MTTEEAILRRHWKLIRQAACKACAARPLPDDALSDALLAALLAVRSHRDHCGLTLRDWLWRQVQLGVIDGVRRRGGRSERMRRWRRWSGPDAAPAALDRGEPVLDTLARKEEVQRALSRMTAREAEAFRLHFLEGLSGPECMRRLGLRSPTSLFARLRDGKARALYGPARREPGTTIRRNSLMVNEEITRAWNRGADDRLAGVPLGKCPYAGTGQPDLYNAWRQGWLDTNGMWGRSVGGRWPYRQLPEIKARFSRSAS